jgi:uncharacterized membrane protein YedE/YeeE
MPPADSAPFPIRSGALIIAALLGLATAVVTQGHGARQLALFVIAIALGTTLAHASFGFASAYRRLLEGRGTRAVRAQLLMIAIASVLFAPVLAAGEVAGIQMAGAVAPAGFQVACGAFLFGIGMQFAGACASGSLYGLAGGQLRLLLTIGAFCAGSFWASLHMGAWAALPALEPTALGDRIGWAEAVVAQLVVLGLLYATLAAMPGAEDDAMSERFGGRFRVLRGPWPLAAGALLLATLNLAVLLVAGHPWSITWAFTLWGAKAALATGWSPAIEPFWSGGFQRAALDAGLLADETTVMNLGLVLGAFIAAAMAGTLTWRGLPSAAAALRAIAGGLAMGYGARIAYGCNIGAFFSGIASTSLHGWLWIAAALPGCWVGLRLLRLFGTAGTSR